MSERYRPVSLKRMRASTKAHIKRQLLEQMGTFGKKQNRGQNPLENMSDIYMTAEVLAKAKKMLKGRKSTKPQKLRKSLGMEPTKGNSTLCGIILRELGWKKWNENCHANCTWVRRGEEFD